MGGENMWKYVVLIVILLYLLYEETVSIENVNETTNIVLQEVNDQLGVNGTEIIGESSCVSTCKVTSEGEIYDVYVTGKSKKVIIKNIDTE